LREKSLDNLSLIKQIIDIFSALLSPVIAVSVAYIAYQQWKLNVAKEKRDSKSERLQIYMAVQRLLRNTDNTRKVDPQLYENFQEALALADFYFDEGIIDWLTNVDSNASSWFNYEEISLAYKNKAEAKEAEKYMLYMEESIDRLQDQHCQLLSVFKDRLL
ncbi:hypothetical protein ACUYO2_004223, partial [Vibrio vulnificus]